MYNVLEKKLLNPSPGGFKTKDSTINRVAEFTVSGQLANPHLANPHLANPHLAKGHGHMLTRQMLTRQMLTGHMLTGQMLTPLAIFATIAHKLFV